MYTVLDTFAGIGGFSLALESLGEFKTVAFCEINSFCQSILAKNFPGVAIVEDINNANQSLERIGITSVDVITGGFPCQPFSSAGKQRGSSDERHLWPQLAATIRHFRPKFIILENVPDLLSVERGGVFGDVLRDLASIGYDAEWQVLPASAFGAFHERERIWIVAYPHRTISPQSVFNRNGIANQERYQETQIRREDRFIFEMGYSPNRGISTNQEWLPQPSIPRMVNGLPHELDRIKSLGNAIVPENAKWIGTRILQMGLQ